MEQPDLTAEQQASLDEQLKRGGAFEVLLNQEGFELIRAYISNQVQSFASKALSPGFATMEEYREAKGEVNGLRKLIANMDADIKAVYEHRQRKQATKPTSNE